MRTEKGFIVPVDHPEDTYTFILNPEGFSDDKATEYSKTKIPAISHPIYQYSNGGERKISFELLVVKDISGESGGGFSIGKQLLSTGIQMFGNNLPFRPNARDPMASLTGAVGRVPILGDMFRGSRAAPDIAKIDITDDVLRLRSFLYPESTTDKNLRKTAPRPLLFNYGNYYPGIKCVMTQCGVTWRMWAPDLTPIVAKLSISLEEIIDQNITRADAMKNMPKERSKAGGLGGITVGTLVKTAVGVGAIAAISAGVPIGGSVVKRFGF